MSVATSRPLENSHYVPIRQYKTKFSCGCRGQIGVDLGRWLVNARSPSEVTRILGGKEIASSEVLDIGCGVGGLDIVLVQQHDVRAVLGIDVEKELAALASDRSCKNGLEDKIKYQLVEPGPFPFDNQSFDNVFSKDAIIHMQDKQLLYSEMFRVLRPGGWVMVGHSLSVEQLTSSQPLEDLVVAAEDFIFVSAGIS